MKTKVDLTNGNILERLIKLALPIMATSFIHMGYNMIDMMWVGRIGSDAVAAVGTAGFFPWLAMAFIMISKVGAEVKVAQSIGKDDIDATKTYIKSAIEINLILSILYALTMIVFNKYLIGIFRLDDIEVITMARKYLIVVACGMLFYFINPVFTAIFNGMGNSKIPFKINTIGLITNIVLDPILIFGIGPIKGFGVVGAALATVFAQVVVSVSFIAMIIKKDKTYFKFRLYKNINKDAYNELCNIGLPVALQSGMFTVFSMALGVIVASFGPVAIAVQKVGSQIESISWMTAQGIGAALSSFVGQNYGAQKLDRVEKGAKVTLIVATVLGTINTLLLVFLGKEIFSLFIDEKEAIEKGVVYLKILGYSQLFMCIEIVVASVFTGLSKPLIPSILSIILTGLRIPLAYILSSPNILGLNGIWWSISISSILKGTLLLIIFIYMLKLGRLYNSDLKLRFSGIRKH